MANTRNNIVELIVNGQQVDLLKSDLGIRLTSQLLDPTKILSKAGEYSYTFNLPSTKNNNRIFGHINIASKLNKFANYYHAELLLNNIQIFEGELAIDEYSDNQYKCNLFKNKKNQIDEIFEDTKMNEIEWYVPYEGLKTINSVNADQSTKYFFPLVAYSLFQKDVKNTTASGYKNYGLKDHIELNNRFYNNSFVPSMNMVETLKKCFEKKGLYLNGDIISDPILNEIYMSNSIASGQDPLYNIGGARGEVSFDFEFKNFVDPGNGGEYKMSDNYLDYSLDFKQPDYNVKTHTLEKFSNYDTAFVWDALNTPTPHEILRDMYSKVWKIKDEGKLYNKGSIAIPADGWYEITLNAEYGLFSTSSYVNAWQITGQTYTSTGVEDNYAYVGKWGFNVQDMPVELQVLKYDADDGDVEDISHNIIFYGQYPNEAELKDENGRRIPAYINNPYAYGDEFIGTVTTCVDPDNNPNFLIGGSQDLVSNSLAYIKNGYSYIGDEYNNSIYNCPGYFYMPTAAIKDAVQTDYNKNTLLGVKDLHTYNSSTQRTTIQGHMIVKLHKNDIIKMYCQSRGYFDENGKPLLYQIQAKGDFKIRAVAPIDYPEAKLTYGMESLFDKDLNLGNFFNKEENMKDFINNVMKAFNLSFTRDNDSVNINKNKVETNYSIPVDIDEKASTNDAEFSKIDFPNSMKIEWNVDTEEEGFYLSALANSTDEQIQSTSWKDYGDYGSQVIKISTNGDKELKQKVNFSYNWYKDFYLMDYAQWVNDFATTPFPQNLTVPIKYLDPIKLPVIGKRDWWIQGLPYQEGAKNDGRSFKQRFWFRGEQLQDRNYRVPVDTDTWFAFTDDESYKITLCSPSKTINGKTVFLNFNSGENTLVGKYFNIDVNSQGNECDVEVYLTADEYKLINNGASVKFDDDLYKVMKIDGFDIEGKNPTKLRLLKI